MGWNRRLFAGIAAILMIGYVWFYYGAYAKALAWHSLHGHYAQLGHRRVKLPLLWRPVDSGKWDTAKVARAWPMGPYLTDFAPSITAPPRPVLFTSEEQLQSNLAASDMAGRGHMTLGTKVVTLSSPALRLDCLDLTKVNSSLLCIMMATPYEFNYIGAPLLNPADQQKLRAEADAILSTLQ